MRGQAALEYVVTYGWAFVVILVVLGGLAYFGFLSPIKYLPSRCDFGSQLVCVDYELSADGGGVARVRFRNNFGEDIEITGLATPDGDGSWRYFEGGSWRTTGQVIAQDGNLSPVLEYRMGSDEDVVFVNGDRVMLPLIVTFRRASPLGPSHDVVGSIFATAKPATVIS